MVVLEFLFGLVLIAAIGAGIVFISRDQKSARQHKAHIDGLERELDRRLSRLERMEERIAVLETIVTDSRYDLERKFNDLNKTG